ncbi:MAG: SMI1/KNR4 family protein [Solobacterium sp.]|nr:SMI1/KNR4 family protein [Solobacterium sp.]
MNQEELFKDFVFNEKPETVITEVNGLPLPEDYLAFMQEHNGGEGPIGDNGYGGFYRLEELQEVNDEYAVSDSWPGCIVFGSDMGGILWAYSPQRGSYCEIDSSNIDDDTYQNASDTLEAFLEKIA